MMTGIRKTAFSLLTIGLFAFSLNLSASTDNDPVSLVETTANNILTSLNENREQFTTNPELLRDIVRKDLLPMLDQHYSARLILGKASRGASPAQITAFSEAMTSVLINRYSDGLLSFRSSEQLEVMPLKGKNSDKLTRVRTRIKLDNGSYAPVDYAFRKTADGWKAFDVTVEGISYVITFRNQIGPRIEADGLDKVTNDILAGNLVIDEE